jgi:DivIVA domain-containing protein
MALTPEDVVNKRFQPTKFREGYDQDEVDDFLDEVVVELRRLNQENEELRQRLIASDSRISELQRSASQPAPAPAAVEQPTHPAPVAEQPAAMAPPTGAVVAQYQAPVDESNSMDPSSTNNLLQLARRLHEEHVREGVEKRDALIAEGTVAAAAAVAEGQATAAKLLADAEAQQRAQLGALDQERSELERRIDELRNFERDYRQKLKGYIEGQLRDLDATSAAPAAVPATASAPVLNTVGSAPVAAPAAAPAQGFGSPATPPPANYPGFASN